MEYHSEKLVKDIIHMRDAIGISLRTAAKDIGISNATLSRIERGKTPDIITFGLICKWLNRNTSNYLY